VKCPGSDGHDWISDEPLSIPVAHDVPAGGFALWSVVYTCSAVDKV